MPLCITCNKEGHTYLQCTVVSFFDICNNAFGVRAFSSKTPEQIEQALAQISLDKEEG